MFPQGLKSWIVLRFLAARLKPFPFKTVCGTAEAVFFQNCCKNFLMDS
jgi:hypothetical protein